jgi:hypothetical protein
LSALGPGALGLLLLTAGCSGPTRIGGPTQQPWPQSAQADAVAADEFGRLAGGGWAQAWELWSGSAQLVLDQAGFVRLNTECRPVLGIPYVIDRSTTVDRNTVRVDWHRATDGGVASGSNTLVHQAGKWRFNPDPGSLAEYRLGVDALVRQRRAAGTCH